jgi:hypothetical protein
MKTILTTISVLLAISSGQMRCEEPLPKIAKLTDVASPHFGEVPTGKTYLVYDGKGKKVAQFRSGQKTNMTTDCVIIKCPATFGKDVVCWKCMGFTAEPGPQSPAQGWGKWEYVPKGKTYVVYDARRRMVAQFRSGQKTNMTTDCVIIKCPSTFGPDVVCWKCMGLRRGNANREQ